MSTGNVAAVGDAIQTHIGSFHPESPTEFDQFFMDLPEGLFEQLAGCLQGVAEAPLPVEPAFREKLREAAAAVGGLAEPFRETYQVHRQEHEREMKRAEEPRQGEEMWNV